MNDQQLLRYSRHILLEELGIEGQDRLLGAHALVIGAGGLGSPVALYLGSAGVGRITVVDHDVVDETNLQRQIAHTLDRVGLPKAESVRTAIAAINPDVVAIPVVQKADAALLDALVPTADVVLDCTDNFATRQAINAACVAHSKPLVSGAAIRMDGQLGVFDSREATSPCYACVFPGSSSPEETRCATMGVFAPLVGIVGTMQAAEALKLLGGLGSRLVGRLLMIDARDMAFTTITLPRQTDCAVCSPAAKKH
ncbi:molybdopterin biosynthesis protein MoeB [Hydrogenophaga crassostreae]|uniref:Molybdopterin-synthase adenylyltransferase n=1 Tax=Hydrogenophaga crassostreae TaxID=1763535 RepID=A0A167I9H9_9BURK|nr:HesA/MoeB/ThiF family protein [Hydrogenophaga crassostreae]AOW12341.1 molybdopterin biosynthesis protein MoeB [Hydrogenophaga crassostreae]OAD42392.1 molybdopterin biosynthesis protein MoeB [Hydrogenophaga crassostreae]